MMDVGSSSKMDSTRPSTPGGSSARPHSSTPPAVANGMVPAAAGAAPPPRRAASRPMAGSSEDSALGTANGCAHRIESFSEPIQTAPTCRTVYQDSF